MTINRSKITKELSILVEKRLIANRELWAREVILQSLIDSRNVVPRVDYVGFSMPAGMVCAENGVFQFFEIKSCMEDFLSGNGLTFKGDENYLVCPPELFKKLKEKDMIPDDVDYVLTPIKNWKYLRKVYSKNEECTSSRKLSCADLLMQIMIATKHGSRLTNVEHCGL